MRTLTELFVIGALIYLGWAQSFKERVDQVRAKVTGRQTQEIVAMTPTPAPRIVPGIIREPTPQHAWRLDPRHRSPLDPPQQSPSPP